MQRRHDLSGKTIVSTNVIPPFRFIVICVNTDVSAGRREGGGGVAACTVVNKKKKKWEPIRSTAPSTHATSLPPRGWLIAPLSWPGTCSISFSISRLLPSPSQHHRSSVQEDKTWAKISIFQFAKSRRRLTILEPIQIYIHIHIHIYIYTMAPIYRFTEDAARCR